LSPRYQKSPKRGQKKKPPRENSEVGNPPWGVKNRKKEGKTGDPPPRGVRGNLGSPGTTLNGEPLSKAGSNYPMRTPQKNKSVEKSGGGKMGEYVKG